MSRTRKARENGRKARWSGIASMLQSAQQEWEQGMDDPAAAAAAAAAAVPTPADDAVSAPGARDGPNGRGPHGSDSSDGSGSSSESSSGSDSGSDSDSDGDSDGEAAGSAPSRAASAKARRARTAAVDLTEDHVDLTSDHVDLTDDDPQQPGVRARAGTAATPAPRAGARAAAKVRHCVSRVTLGSRRGRPVLDPRRCCRIARPSQAAAAPPPVQAQAPLPARLRASGAQGHATGAVRQQDRDECHNRAQRAAARRAQRLRERAQRSARAQRAARAGARRQCRRARAGDTGHDVPAPHHWRQRAVL